MSKKNKFTYDGGSQYIDWLCSSNKLVLLRDNNGINVEESANLAISFVLSWVRTSAISDIVSLSKTWEDGRQKV